MCWSCDGKLCCVYAEKVRGALQLAAFAYWLEQINANAHKTIHIYAYEINAMVFSLFIYIRCLCVHMHGESSLCVSVASVSDSNCEYISIVLMMLLHAMCVAPFHITQSIFQAIH